MSAGMDPVLSRKETRNSLPCTLSLSPNGNTEERPHQKLDLLAFWSWTSNFFHCQRINGCFQPPLYSISLWQSAKTQLTHRAVCDGPHQGASLCGSQRGWNSKLVLRIRAAVSSLALYGTVWNWALLSANHPGCLQRPKIWTKLPIAFWHVARNESHNHIKVKGTEEMVS